MQAIRRLTLVVVLLAVLSPAVASADIIAATEVPDPAPASDDTDIALIDTATGVHFGLPAGVNTSQNDVHPSITPDGKRLVFERVNVSAGTTRIIVVDLTNGTQADLFNAFDAAQFTPNSPTIAPDGQTVLTGMKFPQQNNLFFVAWTETSLANFPAGPFTHTVREEPNLAFSSGGITRDPDGTFLQLRPAFTPDGRYLMFVDQGSDGVGHLLTFDTVTQTILNPTGVILGKLAFFGLEGREGNVSVRDAFVLATATLVFTGSSPIVGFLLNQASNVGILVQRIVGHHQLFGRRVPTLRPIGRVPFGPFRSGRHSVRWNLRVNGRRLARGRYLVTARALTGTGVVRELGTPHILNVR